MFVIMEALVHQKKSLILILVEQTQNFVWVCIIMMIIIMCLLMGKKSLTFQLNFDLEVFLIDFGFWSLEKFL